MLEGREYFHYTVNLVQSQAVLWDVGWCEVDGQSMYANISNMEYECSLNELPIAQSTFGTMITPNGNHYCYYAFAVLKYWPLGTQVVRTVKVFKTDTDDGVTNRMNPTGRKVLVYLVNVKL